MTCNMRAIACISAVALLAAVPSFAQSGATSQPATQPAQARSMAVTVGEVSGSVQRLTAGDGGKWIDVRAGDRLDELTVVRTGFGSKVVLNFADNSTVTVDRATKMGIGEFRKHGAVTRTAVGLKYGSMKASVEKARGPNNFTVATPVATLAVTGSGSAFGISDFGLNLQSNSGNWNVHAGSQSTTVSGTEGTDNNLTAWVDLSNQQSTPLLVPGNALTANENNMLTNYGQSGRLGTINTVPGGIGGGNINLPPPPPIPPSPPSPPPCPSPPSNGCGETIYSPGV